MNATLLVALVVLAPGGTSPATGATQWPAKTMSDAELNKDPIIARLTRDLAGLNEALIDQVSRSRHTENSKLIVKLRERIQRTEDAIDERKATLRQRPWYIGPLPLQSERERLALCGNEQAADF